MSLGVLIQSMIKGQSAILYSRFYGVEVSQSEHIDFDDDNTDDCVVANPETDTTTQMQPAYIRQERQDMARLVCSKVRDEFLQKCREEVYRDIHGRVSTSQVSGWFPIRSLKAGGEHGCKIVWIGSAPCVISMLLRSEDSSMPAELTLDKVIHFLTKYCDVFGKPSEVGKKVDRINLILDALMPNGQLLIMNHRIYRQCEKQIESQMSKTIS